MFTGIIVEQADLLGLSKGSRRTITITADLKKYKLRIGDSVAVNGICLTVIKMEGGHYSFNISDETYRLSNFSDLVSKKKINIELPLKLNDYLGGHLVNGHIDGTVRVKSIQKKVNSVKYSFVFTNREWKNFLIHKGSVALNGISLTISEIIGYAFSIEIIPHSLDITNLKNLKVNDRVNIELDLIGKYLYNQTLNFRK